MKLKRNRHGRFLKRGAKRRGNPHRRRHGGGHKKRHRAHRRRRGNPHLLVANPSRGGQLPLFDPSGHKISPVLIRTIREGAAMKKKRRKTKRKARRSAKRRTTSHRSHRRRPHAARRRRHGRKYYRIYRGRGRSPKFRIFRRGNPFGFASVLSYARIGVAGGLGIVAARISGRLYTDYVGKHVAGTDPKSWRGIANEVLRLVAMGALPIIVSRQALARVPMLTSADVMAFELGALAEAGRQGVGIAIQKLKPGIDKGRWGLDGMGNYDHVVDNGQHILGYKGGQWWMLGHSNGMNGLQSGYTGTWPLGREGAFGGAVMSTGFGDAYADDVEADNSAEG